MTIAISDTTANIGTAASSAGSRRGASCSDAPVLQARSLELRFGSIQALRSVELTVDGGTIHSVIGPNGAGKSSLLNCLSGFYRPQSGAVLFDGENITRQSPHRRASAGIGRAFQGIQTYQSMTVRENVLAGLHVHMRTGLVDALLHWPRTRAEEERFKAEAEEIIEFLELEDLRHDHVGSLSYGVRKRVDLGRALALRPKVLIMDEPMAGERRPRPLHSRYPRRPSNSDCAGRARHGSRYGYFGCRDSDGLGHRDRLRNARTYP